MSLSAVRVARPQSLAEAVGLLAEHGPNAMIIAGGTDVIPNLQMKLFSPCVLVDIKPLGELRGITWSPQAGLRIGALATLTEVAASPLVREKFSVLAEAVGAIAGPLQRNMGTIGGNLCLETRCHWYNQSYFWRKALGGCLKLPMPNAHAAHPDTICHVAPGGDFCWAVWSGDSAPAFLTLDAEIEIAGPRGARRIPLPELYTNDGMDRITLGRDELLVAVHVPAASAGCRGHYHKLRIRGSIDYPLAGVAAALDVDASGVCRDARVAVAAVNPAPLVVPAARELLVGKAYSPELVEGVAREVIRTGKPLTTSASTPVYRREMLRVFTRRALETAWGAKSNGK
ncbi:MAG TPA: xanthine dehydrogenase family protein subunit M [Candidatus Acidoferrales bacterium]